MTQPLFTANALDPAEQIGPFYVLFFKQLSGKVIPISAFEMDELHEANVELSEGNIRTPGRYALLKCEVVR